MDSVKQSAALCLLRLNRTSPDLVPMGEWTARVVHLLNDQHLVRPVLVYCFRIRTSLQLCLGPVLFKSLDRFESETHTLSQTQGFMKMCICLHDMQEQNFSLRQPLALWWLKSINIQPNVSRLWNILIAWLPWLQAGQRSWTSSCVVEGLHVATLQSLWLEPVWVFQFVNEADELGHYFL